MANDTLLVSTLTHQLVTAWRTGQLLDESAVTPPDNADQAYQVQQQVARAMDWSLDTPVRAWKVGTASKTAQTCRADEHEALIDAIGKADAATATKLMIKHLTQIEDNLDLSAGGVEVDLEAVFNQDS